jgi:hypothetical protein
MRYIKPFELLINNKITMKRIIFLFLSLCVLMWACKTTETTVTPSTATITALTCSSVSFSTTASANTAYVGTASVPYTGGNAVAYSAGSAISSTGVTGLTATLTAATLASGAGNATFTITGTPSAEGTAMFAISLGGQSCSISLAVAKAGTVVTTACDNLTGSAKVVCLAQAFKATLSASQITTLEIAYTKANAIKWSNLPGGVSIRNGLEFSTLNATQLAAAKAVIAAASGTTADEGVSEFLQVNLADDLLGVTAGNGYSAGKYIIAFLGAPSTTGTWMLQFGGHHYAQNIAYKAGEVVGTTPSHQGIEPKTWTSSDGKTVYAPLKTEQSAMAAMLAGLTAAQLTSAKLSTTFGDVSLGPNKDGQFPATKVGIACSTLTAVQKALVFAAMKPWTQDVDDASGTALQAIYEKEIENTYISYSGNSALANNADYVRIDGPSVWIEFVCQSGVVYRNEIHYHAVYRDHTRDYAGL